MKKIYILIGPSGSGKTTLGKALAERGMVELISHTSREPRDGETDGVEYHFVDKDYFTINKRQFIEMAPYSDNLYGLSREELGNKLASNDRLFNVMERAGAQAIWMMINQFCVGDLANSMYLLQGLVKVIPIYIYVEKSVAIKRMLARGDSHQKVMGRLIYAENTNEFCPPEFAKYIMVSEDVDPVLNKETLMKIIEAEEALGE